MGLQDGLDDDFIGRTIAQVDGYLSAEQVCRQREELSEAQEPPIAPRASWREMPLLDQAEYMRWSADVAARDAADTEELAERDSILNEEHDQYWAAHCPAHGEGLQVDGTCASCEGELLEERRQDA